MRVKEIWWKELYVNEHLKNWEAPIDKLGSGETTVSLRFAWNSEYSTSTTKPGNRYNNPPTLNWKWTAASPLPSMNKGLKVPRRHVKPTNRQDLGCCQRYCFHEFNRSWGRIGHRSLSRLHGCLKILCDVQYTSQIDQAAGILGLSHFDRNPDSNLLSARKQNKILVA